VRLTHWRVPARRAALVALVAALTPLPLAAASDPARETTTPKMTIQAAVHAAAVKEAAVVAPAPRAKAARRADQSGSKQSPGFFRTGPGAVALAVMAVGTGYALYSASHDKINSPGKK
jgi:hypothetical protein